MKVIGNLILLISALIFSSVFLLWTYQEEIVDEIGYWMISSYKNQYDSEWKVTLRQLKAGETKAAIEVLEKKKWAEIRNRDRVYPMKRKLLDALAAELHATGQYAELLHWAGLWRQLDERDVTAIAYWYEALRHQPERREEGLLGLERNWERFPSNDALARFHMIALADSGDATAAAQMRKQHNRKLVESMSKGWQVIWNWRPQQALARPVRIELATHLRSWRLIAAWQDIVGIGRLAWSWRGDDRLKQTGSAEFSMSPGDEGWIEVPLRIPTYMTTLRIDPPAGARVRVSDIEILFDDVVYPVVISQLVDQRHYKRMVRKGESLEARGDEDPWVRMNIVDVIGGSEKKAVEVILRFRAAILPTEF